MTVRIVQVPRRPAAPGWAVAVVAVWAGLVAAAVGLSALTGAHLSLCPLRRLTGLPCPTCGATRSALSLLQGEIAAAWLCNPLVFTVAAVAAGCLAARALWGRSLKVNLTRRERIAAWILAGAAVLANWAYVIMYVG